MSTGILHLHTTVVILFLAFMLFKTMLLLLGKVERLDAIRDKTKVVDMILGTLLLVTGIGLIVFKDGMPTYLIIKIVVVLAAIPFGIIGLKKKNKVLAVLSIALLVYAYGIAETKSAKFKPDPIVIVSEEDAEDTIMNSLADAQLKRGKAIYTAVCVECHGEDGKKGLFSATDLTASQLIREQKLAIVTNGKGTMPKYDSQFSEQDLEAVVSYIETLE